MVRPGAALNLVRQMIQVNLSVMVLQQIRSTFADVVISLDAATYTSGAHAAFALRTHNRGCRNPSLILLQPVTNQYDKHHRCPCKLRNTSGRPDGIDDLRTQSSTCSSGVPLQGDTHGILFDGQGDMLPSGVIDCSFLRSTSLYIDKAAILKL